MNKDILLPLFSKGKTANLWITTLVVDFALLYELAKSGFHHPHQSSLIFFILLFPVVSVIVEIVYVKMRKHLSQNNKTQ
jgi:hypothetical protein